MNYCNLSPASDFREWKMFQPSTICKGESGTKIIPFTYGFTTFVREKFIDSCSLGLRQMASKTYHSVARNKAYKAIPSLLLPRPTHRCSTPNRSPLPPAPSFGETAKKNTTFRKVNKIGGFFVFFPPILDPCCPISVPGDKKLLDKSANFANNLKNEHFGTVVCFISVIMNHIFEASASS